MKIAFLWLTAGIVNTDFRQMLDLLLITSDECVIQEEHEVNN